MAGADVQQEEGRRAYAFGQFLLVPERQLLMRADLAVRIGGRALDILTVLVERQGEVVGKRELMDRAWPKVSVEESNLKVNIAALRRALGDGLANPRYIATVVGRGYRFIAPVAVTAPPAETDETAAQRHNLPSATAQVFGRDDVIAAACQELRRRRLLSIVGPGGIGKTTVATAVARQAVGAFRDGVWLVDFAPLTDPALAPNTIATAMGLTAHSANMLSALCEDLRRRDVLLVLDSCEHIIDAVAACAERLLAETAGVKILVTSREPLRLRDEHLRRLTGLGLPESGDITAEKALTFPAVQLFVDRAAAQVEGLRLTDANAPVVADICRKLDGLALAIEIAATRIDAFGFTGLLRQVDERCGLGMARRGGSERHRTLTATIAWSYDLLTEGERAVMRRISTIASSFGFASACAVAAGGDLTEARVFDALANLVEKSLLSAEARDSEIEYRMLETTRAYAFDRLAAEGELAETGRRHAEHVLGLAGRAESEYGRLASGEWLLRYGGRIDDIRSALSWAAAAPDPALLVRLTVAAIPFWKELSLLEECRVAVVRALDDAISSSRDARQEFVLQLNLGAMMLHTRGPAPEVKAGLSRALEIADALEESELQLESLRWLSEYELWTGEYHAAIVLAEKMRAMSADADDAASADADAQAGSALSWLGALAASRYRLDRIVRRPVSGGGRADASRVAFDRRLTAQSELATVLWLQGFPDRALETARRLTEEAEESNYAVARCYTLLHVSVRIALYLRDYDAAAHYVRVGEEHAAKHGLTVWRDLAVGSWCRLHLYLGKPVDLAASQEALENIRGGGFRMRYVNALTNYGEALARQGDPAGGIACIDEAIALSESTGQIVGIPEMLRIKGNVLRFEMPGRAEDAAACYRRSIAIARRDGALSWELRSAMSLVKLNRARGGPGDDDQMLTYAYERFTEGFASGDLVRARRLLEA